MRRPSPAYEAVQHLHGELDGSPLSEWERLSLAALRSLAKYRDTLLHGDPFEAAHWYSLYHMDRVAARAARRKAGL